MNLGDLREVVAPGSWYHGRSGSRRTPARGPSALAFGPVRSLRARFHAAGVTTCPELTFKVSTRAFSTRGSERIILRLNASARPEITQYLTRG